MTFYLKPPRGIIEYHILQKCVEERIKCLNNIFNSTSSLVATEYLYEDSAFDRASHFTLRLAAVQDFTFLTSFISREIHLLKLRLDTYTHSLLYKFLKKLLRHASESIIEYNENEQIVAFLNVLVNIVMKMCSRSYRTHVFKQVHLPDDKCNIFSLNVPFQYCISLVSVRAVQMKNGYANISCEQWKELILSLYYTFLQISVREFKHSNSVQVALQDHRIKSILSLVLHHQSNSNGSVNLEDFNLDMKSFPLCMLNLHQILCKNHRLAHEDRYNYSIFLKDIGMSLENSIIFWKNEYSKESSSCGKCTHSWQQDEKKFTYSIRHLYGLEGSRKNYKTRSCDYFQQNVFSPMEGGGCPFKQFDKENLEKLLSGCVTEESVNEILLARLNGPSNACKLFMQLSLHNSNDMENSSDDLSFNNPVQYFQLMKTKINEQK